MPSKLLTWNEVCPGGTVTEPGSSVEYRTGTWRAERPVHDMEQCTHCMICWIYCPDASIVVEGGRWTRFDYDHCKGCGVCAQVCPINIKNPHATTGQIGKVIQMVPEKS